MLYYVCNPFVPMSYSHRFLLVVAGFCFATCFTGCSNAGTSKTAASTVPPPTPILPAPTPQAKAKFVYIGNEGASLSGYAVDPSSGALTPLNGFPFAFGSNPTILTHDPQNRFLIVADNGAADLLHVFAIDSTTGALKEIGPSPYITKNQPGTVITDPSGTHLYLYVSGENGAYPGQGGNQVHAYNLSSTGVLTEVVGSPFFTGSIGISASADTPGMVTDAAGKFLYVQDLANLYTFGIDASSGALTLLQTLPLESGYALAIDPAGSYLYTVGSKSILGYSIHPVSGVLKLAKSSPAVEGDGAITITLSPNGQFAYTLEGNNSTFNLVSYAISNGSFTPVGKVYPNVWGWQIAVDPSGSFVYVPQACIFCPDGVYNVIHEFSIGSTGALTPLPGSPVPGGVTPSGITVTSQSQ
jgi:6-phosphogluconolactonase (cycloisomerase 2 family)